VNIRIKVGIKEKLQSCNLVNKKQKYIFLKIIRK